MPADAMIGYLRHHAEMMAAMADALEADPTKLPEMDMSAMAPQAPMVVPAVHSADGAHPFTMVKADNDEHLVFGWASIVADVNGDLIPDAHGDLIAPAELEKAVYDFVLEFGKSGEMHRGGPKGQLVESLMLTAEKAQAMGLPAPMDAGWWIGVKVDPEVFEKVKSREYSAFSIEGTALGEMVA